jgi:hypothetical protein
MGGVIDKVLIAVIWISFAAMICSLGLVGLCTARYVLDRLITRRRRTPLAKAKAEQRRWDVDRRDHIAAVTCARVDAPSWLPASFVECEQIYRLPSREPRSHA